MQEDELLSLAYNSVRKRVALALVKLHDKQQNSDHQITTSREDIAQLAGTATESAIRILTEFKEDGLISSEGRAIIVNDKEALLNLPY